jgi:hypothetical protein
MTYDEIQIAALIGVSTPTYFINDGNRGNRGARSNDEGSSIICLYLPKITHRIPIGRNLHCLSWSKIRKE